MRVKLVRSSVAFNNGQVEDSPTQDTVRKSMNGINNIIATNASNDTNNYISNKDISNIKRISNSRTTSLPMPKTTSPSVPKKKKVVFDDVTVRTYPIVLGDNPGGSAGPPLTIDWKHDDELRVSIEFF